MNTTPIRIIPIALVLTLAACQQQPKPVPAQAPAATRQVTPSPPSKTEAPTAKPAAPAPALQTAAPTATAKPSQPAATKQAAPAKPSAPITAPAAAAPKAAPVKPMAASPKPEATVAATFSTTRCKACHAIDHDKVGPSWKEDVKAYGTEQNLAKVFLSGFAVKDRAIASKQAKWEGKAGLMTMQYRNLIKGHEKAAAHALFMTVKHGKFGSY